MKLLVDTHVFLWMQAAPDRIRKETRALLVSGENEVLLSVASIWEMAIKSGIGRLPLPEPLDRYVESRCRATAISLLPISAAAAFEVGKLPAHHADPFDRMLIAQARTEDLRFVSADRTIRRYTVDLVRA